MSDVRIYTEFGIGNRHFISTEIEKGMQEKRVRGCVRMHIKGVYLRLWIGKKACIVSTLSGFSTMRKNRNAFKMILGFEGVRFK